MKNICFLFILLSACASVNSPDAGYTIDRDSAIVTGDADIGTEDASPVDSGESFPDAGDASVRMCAGLPSDGYARFVTVSNTCDGPLRQAQRVDIRIHTNCTTVIGNVQLICDSMYTEQTFVSSVQRTGTMYTTLNPIYIACEDTMYSCSITRESLSNTLSLDCEYGGAICTVVFEEM